MYAVMNPILISNTSLLVKLKLLLYISSALAANIVGIAKKKLNSTTAFFSKPNAIPPIIVAPERDTPGMNASVWNIPSQNAFLKFIFFVLLSLLKYFSKSTIIIPPTRSDQRTRVIFPIKYFLTKLYAVSPIITVGMNATETFLMISHLPQSSLKKSVITASIAPS